MKSINKLIRVNSSALQSKLSSFFGSNYEIIQPYILLKVTNGQMLNHHQKKQELALLISHNNNWERQFTSNYQRLERMSKAVKQPWLLKASKLLLKFIHLFPAKLLLSIKSFLPIQDLLMKRLKVLGCLKSNILKNLLGYLTLPNMKNLQNNLIDLSCLFI